MAQTLVASTHGASSLELWILQNDDHLPVYTESDRTMILRPGFVPFKSQRLSQLLLLQFRKSNVLFPSTEPTLEKKLGPRRSSKAIERRRLSQNCSRYLELALYRSMCFVNLLRSSACLKILSPICFTSIETRLNAGYCHSATWNTLAVSDTLGAEIQRPKLDTSTARPSPKCIYRSINNRVSDRTHTIILPPIFVDVPANRTVRQSSADIDLTDFLSNLLPNAGPIIK